MALNLSYVNLYLVTNAAWLGIPQALRHFAERLEEWIPRPATDGMLVETRLESANEGRVQEATLWLRL